MKIIYVVNVRTTGVLGGIINSIDSAYSSEKKALEVVKKMDKEYLGKDPNYLAYVTGPIVLNENEPEEP